MIDTTYRRRLLGTSMFVGAALAASVVAAPAMAQTSQEDTVDTIVVTGSRIARQDYVSTSPIVTVGQEDFQSTGSVTIDSLINDLPQFVPSINSTSNNPSNGGQANINLRGLGTVRTLVLMNGRRVIPSNSDGTVDVNIFPTALLRNVEVISGGASAAYGSDALAGVANFILNEQFEGVQFDAQYGITDRNDGATESYSLTMGAPFADDRGHAIFSLGRSTRDFIYNAARDFSSVSGASGASPLGSTVFDANNLPTNAFVRSYFNDATLTNTGSFGFNDNGSVFSYVRQLGFVSPGGIDYDGFRTRSTDYVYNTGPLNYNQLPLDRWNAYSSLTYKLNDAAELYGSLLFTEYSAAQELAASPAAAATGFRVPSTNPFITPAIRSFLNARPNPAGSFRLDKRFNEVGGRRSTENYTIYQGTFGVRGDVVGLKDWTYDIYAQYGRNERTTLQTGNVSRSAVQTLLDAADGGASICAGGFDPFGISNMSPACVAYIARVSQNVTAQEQTVVEASLQGGLFDMPAGEARFAAGIQYREDDYDFRPDASLSRVNPTVTRADGGTTGGSEIAGFNPTPALKGTTNSLEYFAELLVPLLADMPFIQSLDLNLGYRYSDYSTVGGVQAYKADLDWAVVDSLRFRGGYSRSVRAPSIGELFAAGGTTFPSIGSPSATGLSGDPCDIRSSYRQASNPNAAAVRALCIAQGISAAAIDNFVYSNQQVSGISGGNPNLFEETSDSFTVGAVFTSPFQSPWLSGISASVDYYNIEITDVIGSVGASTQLQGCFNAQGQNPTYSNSNGFCQLFVRDPLSGSVQGAQEIQSNLATLKTSGIDAQFDWTVGLADVGAPDWGNLALNVVIGWLENRERQDVAGGPFINRTGTIDSVFGNTFPEWKSLTSLTWANGPFSVGARWRHVGEMRQFATTTDLDSADYYDLIGSWAINDTVSLRATVNNVGDEQPIVYSPGVQANTDPSTYDTLGRRYSIGLTARF
ncbi:TonB-dependent receptor plug domain-containing protein [Brevundimonas staleyi]|uniref:TonB-dependent receptor plug domain-containing protein n=1 Tax=Brevundimonas staleyi TaxID=74326 RepID=A0ABW0FM12_9CAUL